MDDSSRRKPSLARRRSWCCSFSVPPGSPDSIVIRRPNKATLAGKAATASSSVPNSPQSAKSGLGLGLVGRIDPRRILSPGRVSPINSDPIQEIRADSPFPTAAEVEDSDSAGSTPNPPPPVPTPEPAEARSLSFRAPSSSSLGSHVNGNVFDVRLNLRGKRGGMLALELNSEILCTNSDVFAGLVGDYRKGTASEPGSSKICRIEVPEVENLAIFKETIELMFEDDIAKKLLKIGVYRAIDVLEVSAGIIFARGVSSCLKYLEAVPWTEEEEEKLRDFFTRFTFDDETTRDILARLYPHNPTNTQQNLARQLVWSLTLSTDTTARNALKSLVKGLLCKSSVYEKDHPDLDKEDLYAICQSCFDSLAVLFDEDSSPEKKKPLIERVGIQVENLMWVLEILLDWQMAEEFVDMWANQDKLLKSHETGSPMVRYELSRVSSALFIAMGTRKLHCRVGSRSAVFESWFGPFLSDFGWLQRRRKGLNTTALEEATGQALLTLPLSQQYGLFMEWFRCFSRHGSECPNLSKAFQVWWRRSFLRGSESQAVESR